MDTLSSLDLLRIEQVNVTTQAIKKSIGYLKNWASNICALQRQWMVRFCVNRSSTTYLRKSLMEPGSHVLMRRGKKSTKQQRITRRDAALVAQGIQCKVGDQASQRISLRDMLMIERSDNAQKTFHFMVAERTALKREHSNTPAISSR